MSAIHENNQYKETIEYYEDLVNRLRSMRVTTGLCRTEKETLEESAIIIENLAAALFMKGEYFKSLKG